MMSPGAVQALIPRNRRAAPIYGVQFPFFPPTMSVATASDAGLSALDAKVRGISDAKGAQKKFNVISARGLVARACPDKDAQAIGSWARAARCSRTRCWTA